MPEPSDVLTRLGELSKPVTALIERISDAIGVVFESTQIKRVAKAEADAALIRAVGEIAVTDLQRRAMQRALHEGVRWQENIEQITRLALPDVGVDARPEEMDSDWLAHFFDRSRLVSDTDMQTLWARVLAGEANSPGAFGRRTIDLVASIEKEEARLFTSLCGFGWDIGSVRPLIYDPAAEIYLNVGINFTTLTNLDAIGLIRFSISPAFILKGLPKTIKVRYHGRQAMVQLQTDTNNKLETGSVMFTNTGEQLASIAGAQPISGFFEYVCEVWKNKGCKVEETT